MAFNWKKLNWKAIGLGVVVALIVAVLILGIIPGLQMLTALIGGLAAVWYGKIKDFKDGAITGGLVGAIEYIILIMIATLILGVTENISTSVISISSGFVLGAIGGLIGTRIVKKK